ncbi:MAG: hypothetical protein COB89_06240 [Piscirickettsiaceae bacterium]|nr:MAG: hypothetical protein COB89_06240 [Piscirickettsiaceae bacterium]
MLANFIETPSRSPQPDIWATLAPVETKKWVQTLPSADYSQVIELVHQRLLQMNHIDANALELFESTELIRPVVYDALHHFTKKPMGTTFPISDDNKKLSERLLSITTELAISYWSIADYVIDNSAPKRLKKNSALIAQRAIAGLGQIILLHYLYKQQEPAGIWLDIHQLFITFQHDSERSVSDKVARDLPKTSILSCYKQLVLLRLAHPYGLLQTEIIELFFLLEKWSDLVQLTLLNKKPAQNNASCLIDFKNDSSATWQPFLGQIDLSNLLRLLDDYEEFVDDEIGRFETTAEKGPQLGLSPGLIKHLESCWNGNDLSFDTLFEQGSTRVCTLGLKAIHKSLTSVKETQPIALYEHLAETCADNRLQVLFSEAGTLSLGQLVAFRQPNRSRQHLTLAITSDIRYQGASLQFQLQKITHKPYPAHIQPLDSGDQAPQAQPVIIFFSVDENDDKKTWIIVELKNIKLGDRLQLTTSKRTVIAEVMLRKHVGAWCYLLQCKILKNR